jgi:ABC-type transport system involved in cytochrome bd biosynthesis fused ATPase/permease subunit
VRWLLVGSLAVAVLAVTLIIGTLRSKRTYLEIYRPAEVALLVSAVLSLAVGLTDWGAKASLTAMVLLLLAPVVTGILVWVKRGDEDFGTDVGAPTERSTGPPRP